MTTFKTIARTSTALGVAALLGAGVAAAQPADAGDDAMQWLRALNARGEALNAQHGLGGTDADPFVACRKVGAPTSLERSLCYRGAANLANERFNRPSTASASTSPARPIVVGGSAFDWTDAGVGFAAAAGLALLGAGSVVAVRSRRMSTARR